MTLGFLDQAKLDLLGILGHGGTGLRWNNTCLINSKI